MPFTPRSVQARQSVNGGTTGALLATAATRQHFAAEVSNGSVTDGNLWIVPANGTLSNLQTKLDVAPQAATTIVFNVQVDEADSTLTTTHDNANGTAVVVDSANTVAVTKGQRVRIQSVTGGAQAGCDGSWAFDYARS